MTAKALSFDERSRLVRRAIYSVAAPNEYLSALDVYEDSVIVGEDYGGSYYRVAYTINAGEVELAPRDQWQAVEKEWVAFKGLTTLVYDGGSVKALGGGKVGGHLVVFGSSDALDLHGEFFDTDTDFDVDPDEYGTKRMSTYYQHGLDPVLGQRVIGKGIVMGKDDVGVWFEAQLNMRDEYERAIYQLAEAGKLGWSSGTAGHLCQRERGKKGVRIKRWVLVEATLTPTPADPRNHAVPVKALNPVPLSTLVSISKAGQPDTQPEALLSAAGVVNDQAPNAVANDRKHTIEVKDVDNPTVPTIPDEARLSALEVGMKAIGGQLDQVINYMQQQPGIKNVGYFTNDGGAADPEVKSFGDWLLALRRGDTKRLETVYKSAKALNTQTGESGGWLVPHEFNQQLLSLSIAASPILQQVTRIPVDSPSGEFPSLDQFAAPTAGVGETAAAAGVVTVAREEGAAYTETEPNFDQIQWRTTEAISGLIKVTKKLSATSPFAIEALLRRLISMADAAKQEYFIFRGNGAGQPLGILNWDGKIGVTPANDAVFAYADALNMIARFLSVGGSAAWHFHKSIWPDIGRMEVGSGGGAVFQANINNGLQQMLLGYPLGESQHLPQADASGCVVLFDPSSYIIFDLGGLVIDFSAHAGFTEGKDMWRFNRELDGKPWLRDKVTLAGPGSAYTVSPVVYFND